MTPEELNTELGNIDLFILDQILKGTVGRDMKILDAGCGEGRNLIYFLKNNYKIFALDKNPSAIQMVRMHARTMKSENSPDNFIEADLKSIPFPDNFFDCVICASVLHFAKGRGSFQSMIRELLRVLSNGGLLFIKMLIVQIRNLVG